MQMVFQDPFASLNPYGGFAIKSPNRWSNFGLGSKSEIVDRVANSSIAWISRAPSSNGFLTNCREDSASGSRLRARSPPIRNW